VPLEIGYGGIIVILISVEKQQKCRKVGQRTVGRTVSKERREALPICPDIRQEKEEPQKAS